MSIIRSVNRDLDIQTTYDVISSPTGVFVWHVCSLLGNSNILMSKSLGKSGMKSIILNCSGNCEQELHRFTTRENGTVYLLLFIFSMIFIVMIPRFNNPVQYHVVNHVQYPVHYHVYLPMLIMLYLSLLRWRRMLYFIVSRRAYLRVIFYLEWVEFYAAFPRRGKQLLGITRCTHVGNRSRVFGVTWERYNHLATTPPLMTMEELSSHPTWFMGLIRRGVAELRPFRCSDPLVVG